MTKLEHLAELEMALEAEVLAVQGRMDEKTAQLRDAGVFGRYSDVFRDYLALAAPPESDVEALKRATFLARYEVAEPSCFTGVGDLPEDARAKIMVLLEAIVPSLDVEFRWMLLWYYQIADYAFAELERYPNLESFFAAAKKDESRQRPSGELAMANRGLMGKYWISVSGPASQDAQTVDSSDTESTRRGKNPWWKFW